MNKIVVVAVFCGCSHVGGIEGDSAVGHDVTVVGVASLRHVMIILRAGSVYPFSTFKFIQPNNFKDSLLSSNSTYFTIA